MDGYSSIPSIGEPKSVFTPSFSSSVDEKQEVSNILKPLSSREKEVSSLSKLESDSEVAFSL